MSDDLEGAESVPLFELPDMEGAGSADLLGEALAMLEAEQAEPTAELRFPAAPEDADTAAGRCWAYGPQGLRCEGRGGHLSEHSISLRWTDEECVTPANLGPPSAPAFVKRVPEWNEILQVAGVPEPIRQEPSRFYDDQGNAIDYDDTPMDLPSTCASCNHTHVGPCPVRGCGCLNAV